MRRHGHALPRAPGEPELESRLDEAQARYRALVERLPVVIYTSAMDVQGSFTYISPQVEGLLGFKPEDWLADPGFWLKRLHPDDRRRIFPALVRAHRGGEAFAAEYRLLDRAGRARWVRDESQAVRGRAGKPLLIQGAWSDITARKELERETADLRRELASSKAELEEFVSVASHELSSPLRRIMGLGETLASRCRGRLDEESESMLARVIDSAALVQELLRGLVRYAEQGRAGIESSEVDMGAVLDQALKQLDEAVAASGAVITREELPKVWAEPALLGRVLFNLLDNALKFRGKDPPRVHVRAERSGPDWVVSVRDNGIGIHPLQARRIFSIFDRQDPGAARSGVGLGLAVCRKIVERLGGRIWVESDPGEGSVFRFTVPAPPGEGAA